MPREGESRERAKGAVCWPEAGEGLQAEKLHLQRSQGAGSLRSHKDPAQPPTRPGLQAWTSVAVTLPHQTVEKMCALRNRSQRVLMMQGDISDVPSNEEKQRFYERPGAHALSCVGRREGVRLEKSRANAAQYV